MAEYINRENAHKSLDDLSSEHLIGNDDDTFISLAKAHDRIEELPTADVVGVVHGEWIEDCDTIVHCSVCKVARNNYFSVDGNLWHYCPNCGAKMDGERRSEE